MFRGHPAELEVLQEFNFDENILPLVECVTSHDGRGTKLTNFKDYHANKLSSLKHVIVEIPPRVNPSKLKGPKKKFFDEIKNSKNARSKYLNQLAEFENIIPCVTLDLKARPKADYIRKSINDLKSNRKAIRLHLAQYTKDLPNEISKVCDEIRKHANDGDIVILNLGGYSITSSQGKKITESFDTLLNDSRFKSYLFCQTIKYVKRKQLNNNKFSSKPVLLSRVNVESVKKSKAAGFDGFSDYAGLMKMGIHITGQVKPHPAFIPVCTNFNGFWGFKGIFNELSSYKTHVYPNYIDSAFHKNLDSKHVENCLGCRLIDEMKSGTVPEDTAPWKKIAILHYLTVVTEYLENERRSNHSNTLTGGQTQEFVRNSV